MARKSMVSGAKKAVKETAADAAQAALGAAAAAAAGVVLQRVSAALDTGAKRTDAAANEAATEPQVAFAPRKRARKAVAAKKKRGIKKTKGSKRGAKKAATAASRGVRKSKAAKRGAKKKRAARRK